MTDVNYRELASKWWVLAATPAINKRPKNKKIIDAVFNAASIMGVDTDGLKEYLKQLAPRKSNVNDENVAYYDNSYKYSNNRPTSISSGRFLKKVIPSADDKLVEAFTIFWKNCIVFDPEDYVLSFGKTQQDFKDAFTNYYNASGVDYDRFKSISDSCMRYAFPNLPNHPSEAYASGDFEVVTIKSKSGKTRARCVVRVKWFNGCACYVYGSIYASNNFSGEMILSHLHSIQDSRPAGCGGWNGARLKYLPFSDDAYTVAPYVDGHRYMAWVKDCPDRMLAIADDYSIDLMPEGYESNNTSGYVYVRKYKQYVDPSTRVRDNKVRVNGEFR